MKHTSDILQSHSLHVLNGDCLSQNAWNKLCAIL